MSGRFQTFTVASEGTEEDDKYQKMVADIEEQTHRSVWLYGRGAFDKGDLQYLRDFNNSLRYKEVEIEDKEKELWERERARLEAEAAAALTRSHSGGSGPAGSSAPGLRGPPQGLSSRPTPLLLPVKVKPASSKQHQTPQSASSPAMSGLPSCKRARTDSGTHISSTAAAALSAAPAPPPPALRNTKSEPDATSLSDGGSHEVHEHGVIGLRSLSALDASGVEAGKTVGRVYQRGNDRAAAPGLATLLGGYGSEDEEQEQQEHQQEAREGAGCDGDGRNDDGRNSHGAGGDAVSLHGVRGSAERSDGKGRPGAARSVEVGPRLPPPIGLLSPEEVLTDPRVITEGLMATRPHPQNVQGGDAWDSEESSTSDSDV